MRSTMRPRLEKKRITVAFPYPWRIVDTIKYKHCPSSFLGGDTKGEPFFGYKNGPPCIYCMPYSVSVCSPVCSG